MAKFKQAICALHTFLFHTILISAQEINDQNIIIPSNKQKHRKDSLFELLNSWQVVERGITKEDALLLNEYGCWCFFEEDFVLGAGPAQDPVDEICKTLSKGYECAMMDDLANNGNYCVPYEVQYNSAFASGMAPFGVTLEMLVEECERQNVAGSCECMTCKIEGWFLLSYFTYSVYGGLLDSNMMHSNGFDHDANCKTSLPSTSAPKALDTPVLPPTGGNGGGNPPTSPSGAPIKQTPKKCCGEHPKRFSYMETEDHMCCVDSTFNPLLMECCGNGSIQITCL